MAAECFISLRLAERSRAVQTVGAIDIALMRPREWTNILTHISRTGGDAMKLIIEARVECTDSDLRREPIRLAVLDRIDDDLEQLGLTLEEGRALLAAAQSALISSHTELWLVSPLSQALPKRITPALEYLQVKWAAHLPYAAATALLKEVLPLQDAISTSRAKSRMRTIGRELDARIERAILAMPKADTTKEAIEATQVTAVSVDSAWLKHCVRTRFRGRQVNIVAGRATRADGTTKVVAYVGKRVVSAAARLDHFLAQQGVKPDERVTVISDGAGEFVKAVEGSQFARGRILDWFHIAMRFRAAEQSILSARLQKGPDWDWIAREIKSAKWLVWHGKGRKAIPRMKAINEELEKWPNQERSTLWWSVYRAYAYVESNVGLLVNYGARYRKGLPIASSIAESAVNQVVSVRMAKKQQMRWTDEGAHVVALVRVADLNGELSTDVFGHVTRPRRSAIDRFWAEPMSLAA